MRIGTRLFWGFGLTSALIASIATAGVMLSGPVVDATQRVRDVRAPLAADALMLSRELSDGAAAVRDYLLTHDAPSRERQASSWTRITSLADSITSRAHLLTPADAAKWQEIDDKIDQLKAVQEKITALVGTASGRPAEDYYQKTVLPDLAKLYDKIEKSPDFAKGAVIGSKAAVAQARLRDYLATGLEGDKAAVEEAIKAAEALMAKGEPTTSAGLWVMSTMKKAIVKRASPDWDVPLMLLETQNRPLMAEVDSLLMGTIGESGAYEGGLVSDQMAMLTAETADATDKASTLRMILGIGGLGTLAIAALIAVLITRSLTRPIQTLTGAMQVYARGDYTTEAPGTARKDEVGAMARVLEVFRVQLAEMVVLQRRQEEGLREQQAFMRSERERIAGDLLNRVGQITEEFRTSAGAVAASAQSLSQAAAATDQKSSEVSISMNSTADNVQAVAASTEELVASIGQISERLTESARISDMAFSRATEAAREIADLNRAADAIGEVIALINGVASQTNLLALNATIEAARAGEYGKGFAVVASEVKQLAGQTGQATQQITDKISEMQAATSGAVRSIQQILDTMSDVRQNSGEIAQAIGQQGAATEEIAGNTERAALGASTAAGNLRSVTDAARVTGEASEKLLGLSASLSRRAEDLTEMVERFVSELRAA